MSLTSTIEKIVDWHRFNIVCTKRSIMTRTEQVIRRQQVSRFFFLLSLCSRFRYDDGTTQYKSQQISSVCNDDSFLPDLTDSTRPIDSFDLGNHIKGKVSLTSKLKKKCGSASL